MDDIKLAKGFLLGVLASTGLNIGFGIARGAIAVVVHMRTKQQLSEYTKISNLFDTITKDSIEQQKNLCQGSHYQHFCRKFELPMADYQANFNSYKQYIETKKSISEIEIENNERLLKQVVLSMVPLIGMALANQIMHPQVKGTTEFMFAHFLEPANSILSLLLFNLSENYLSIGESRKTDWMKEDDKTATKKGYTRNEIDVVTATSTRKIECWQREHPDWRPKDQPWPTVVLFHPNACTGSAMWSLGNYYYKRGYDVVMPTIGGYPGSPGVMTSEASLYQDIEAIKIYLAKQGVKEVGFHGLSLGGAMAIEAGSTDNPTDNLKTTFVVADQTFTSASEVAGNVVSNFADSALRSMAKGVMNAALPKGDPILLPGGKVVASNGLDCNDKLQNIKEKNIPIQFIVATKDSFTGKDKDTETKSYQKDFGYEMSRKVYPDNPEEHVILLPGMPHGTFLAEASNDVKQDKFKKEAINNLTAFLKSAAAAA